MSEISFNTHTFLPDGSTYDKQTYLTSDLEEHLPNDLIFCVDVDSEKKTYFISSPIGELSIVWAASIYFAAFTILKDGLTVCSGVMLSGINNKEEDSLLKYYIEEWKSFDHVKALVSTPNVFSEALIDKSRPLMVSVNWATISKKSYDDISYFDVFLASKYFEITKLPRPQ
jgi:hypothetical protein